MKWLFCSLAFAVLFGASALKAAEREVWVSVWTEAKPHSAAAAERQRDLVNWFKHGENLAWVRENCELNFYDSSHPRYQTDEFQQAFPALPVIVVQEYQPSTGKWKQLGRWAGDDIGWNAVSVNHNLRRAIGGVEAGGIFKRRRNRRDDECGPDGCPEPPPLKYEALDELERQRQADERAERDAEERRRRDEEQSRRAMDSGRAADAAPLAPVKADEKELTHSVGTIAAAVVAAVILFVVLAVAMVGIGIVQGIKGK